MKTSKKTARILLLCFVLFIIVSEIFLRVRYYEQLKARHYPLIYQADSLLGYTYIAGIEEEINIPGISKKFKINDNGYYGPAFSKEENGRQKIAIIGASEASGIWLNSDSNFCYHLQHMLDDSHMKAEVLNFSMDGKVRDVNNVRLINTDVIRYKPDLVLLTANLPFIQSSFRRAVYKGYVLNYNGNNPQSEKWCKSKIDYIESHWALKQLYNISYIVRAACRYYMYHSFSSYSYNAKVFVEKRIQAPDIRFLPYSLNRSLNMLKDTKENLAKIDCDFVMYYYQKNNFYKRILDTSNIQSLFLDIPEAKDFGPSIDGHYNEEAQLAIAQKIFRSLDTANGRIIVR